MNVIKNNVDEIRKNVKVCSKCKLSKSIKEFGFSKKEKDGLSYYCKECNREYAKLNHKNNKEKCLSYRKEYHLKNKDKIKKYRKKNQFRRNKQDRERRKIDPLFKLNEIIRVNINRYLLGKKSKKTLDILGCSIEEFKTYIEKQFKEGMNWDNHTKDGWHLDHKIPLASAKIEEDLYKLNHYTNFQPLWWWENQAKKARILN
jgi:hypothetical protein